MTLCLMLIGALLQAERTHADAVTLTYRIERAGDQEKHDLEAVVHALKRRLRAERSLSASVAADNDRIRVRLNTSETVLVERVKRLVSSTGVLGFRVLANKVDHKELIERAGAKGNASDPSVRIVEATDDKRIGKWVDLSDMSGGMKPETVKEFAIVRADKKGEHQVLVAIDRYDVTGAYLTMATVGLDELDRPCVDFALNKAGADRLEKLTGKNLPNPATGLSRRLGVILDDVLISAPTIRSKISSHGRLTGEFTKQEAEVLVNVLNAGVIPAKLVLQSVERHEP